MNSVTHLTDYAKAQIVAQVCYEDLNIDNRYLQRDTTNFVHECWEGCKGQNYEYCAEDIVYNQTCNIDYQNNNTLKYLEELEEQSNNEFIYEESNFISQSFKILNFTEY